MPRAGHYGPAAAHKRCRAAWGVNFDMPEWLEIVVLLAAYIVLMRWILPKFGVST